MLTAKHTNLVLSRIAFALIVLTTTRAAFAQRNEPAVQEKDAGVEPVPKDARFDLKGINDEAYAIAGRLSIRRQFLGTRATPSYRDTVRFHCFNGDELARSTFTDPKLEERLLKQLVNGHSLPVVATVQFERVRVGHDGINSRDRLMPRIAATDPATVESVCAAAEAASFTAAASEQFKASLNPDYEKDGIAILLGNVSARLRGKPKVAAVGIAGIKVFNSTTEAAKVEIVSLSIEQAGESQVCVLNARTRAPKSWAIEAGDWSDGAYETGKMPGTLWLFDGSGPIDPKAKVKVQLKFKLNGSEPIAITRTIEPA